VAAGRVMENLQIKTNLYRGIVKAKRNASVARCAPNPARSSSIDLDLRSVTPAAFRLRLLPEQCCHLQLLHGPITEACLRPIPAATLHHGSELSNLVGRSSHELISLTLPLAPWHRSRKASKSASRHSLLGTRDSLCFSATQ